MAYQYVNQNLHNVNGEREKCGLRNDFIFRNPHSAFPISSNCSLTSRRILEISYFSRSNDPNPGQSHFADRSLSIARIQIHRPAGVANHPSLKAEAYRVQSRELHTVIESQAGNENFLYTPFREIFRQPGRASSSIVENSAIAVDIRIDAFLKNGFDQGHIQAGRDLRAFCSLHTVHWPKYLGLTS